MTRGSGHLPLSSEACADGQVPRPSDPCPGDYLIGEDAPTIEVCGPELDESGGVRCL
jgi:hypothetical protein